MNQPYLYCFDVDGTLLTKEMVNESEHIKGIIKEDVLDQLEQYGHKIVIVSPSPYLPAKYKNKDHWIKDYVVNEERFLNVKKAMSLYGYTKDNTIYIDDSESLRNQVSKALEVKVLSSEQFLSSLQSIKA